MTASARPSHHTSRLGAASGLDRRSFLGLTGAAAGLALGGGLLSSCANNSPSSTASGDGPLDIAVSLPLTGPYATAYGATYVGLKIAIDEVNAAGGILGRQVRQQQYDDQATPSNAIAVARKMQADKRQFAVGPTGSGTSIAAAPAINAAKILNAPYSTDASLGDAATYPWSFVYSFTSFDGGTLFFDTLAKAGGNKLGILVEQGEFASSLLDGIAEANADGVELTQEAFAPLTEDLVPYMRRLQSAGVDAVAIASGTPALSSQFAAGCEALSWYPSTVSLAGIWSPTSAALLPAQMADRVYATTFASCVYDGDAVSDQDLVAIAEKLTQDPTSKAAPAGAFLAPFGDFIRSLKQAAEMADSLDPAKVKEALESGEVFSGSHGDATFSATSHLGFQADSIKVGLTSSMLTDASHGGIFLKAGSAS